MPTNIVAALRTATKDLLYTSESDEPFEVFEWKNGKKPLTKKRLLELAGEAKDRPVESVSIDEFFADLTKEEDWHEDDEKAIVAKYRNLITLIHARLSDAKVYRVGDVEVNIYIVCRTEEGNWAGVKTKAVET